MKSKLIAFSILVFSFSILVLLSCFSKPKDPANFIIGKWAVNQQSKFDDFSDLEIQVEDIPRASESEETPIEDTTENQESRLIWNFGPSGLFYKELLDSKIEEKYRIKDSILFFSSESYVMKKINKDSIELIPLNDDLLLLEKYMLKRISSDPGVW